jgi:hypothetical protein
MTVQPGQIINPTGKGGFGDHPENKANGRWKKENTQGYCLNFFLQLTELEFLKWSDENPPEKRTVAQAIAWSRVAKAKKELPDYKEVVDRTEGKAMQYSDITTDGKQIISPLIVSTINPRNVEVEEITPTEPNQTT